MDFVGLDAAGDHVILPNEKAKLIGSEESWCLGVEMGSMDCLYWMGIVWKDETWIKRSDEACCSHGELVCNKH